jgi:hypothetical protein
LSLVPDGTAFPNRHGSFFNEIGQFREPSRTQSRSEYTQPLTRRREFIGYGSMQSRERSNTLFLGNGCPAISRLPVDRCNRAGIRRDQKMFRGEVRRGETRIVNLRDQPPDTVRQAGSFGGSNGIVGKEMPEVFRAGDLLHEQECPPPTILAERGRPRGR